MYLTINILWPLAIFLWVVLVNRFPEGYVYVSGDFAQPINIATIFKNLFYTWGDGVASPGEGGFFSWFAASPYYFVFYLVPHNIGLSETATLSWVLFLFLSSSYFSFLTALKILFDSKLTLFIRTFALMYPLNLTTLYFFTYTWGFSHQVCLYITLPVLAATFFRYITKPSLSDLLVFVLFLFISIPGFTNAAFFIALCLFLLLLLISQFVFRNIFLTKKLTLSLITLGMVSFLAILGWLGPSYLALSGGLSILTDGMFNLNTWLNTQSADILSILIWLPGYKGFYPFSHNAWVFYFFTFIPVFVLLYSLIATRKDELTSRKRLASSLILVSIIFMVLIKKGGEPFGSSTLKLFTVVPFLSVFRSYEKLALFMPFMTLAGIYGLLPKTWLINRRAILICFLTIFSVAPFLIGGIQTKYSITLGSDTSKNYTNSKYSGLVKVPSDYYKIAQIINADTVLSKVQDLPFSVLNTNAWVNYTKWKLIGFNVTMNLFSKPTIGQNASQLNLSGWYPTLDLNQLNLKPEWYVKLLSLFNVSHIVYHKGVEDRFIFKSLPKITELEKGGYLQNVYEGTDASLYKIDDRYQLARFYVPNKTFYVDNGVDVYPYLLDALGTKESANYIFKDTGSAVKVVPKTESLVLLNETSTLKGLSDSSWGQSWLWPPNDGSGKSSPVDSKLNTLIYTAAQMHSSNAYSNVFLQTNMSLAMNGLKSAVEAELLAHPNNSDRNKLIARVIKYLLMLNANFGNSDNSRDFFLPLVKDFDSWVATTLNAGCRYSCYPVGVPKTGEYQMLMENPNNSISALKLYIRGLEPNLTTAVIPLDLNQPYIDIGRSVFNQDRPVKLDVELKYNQPPVLGDSEWEQDSLQGIAGISKKVTGFEPNYKYHLSFKYKGNLQDLFFIVTESALDFETSPAATKESLLQYANVNAGEGIDRLFFTSDSTTGNGRIFIYSGKDEKIKSEDIMELKLEKIVNPKIILKEVSNEDIVSKSRPNIKITKIDPTKYRVLVEGAVEPYSLVFSESFNKKWKVYKADATSGLFHGKELAKDTHFLANGFSNFWLIRPEEVGNMDSYELTIEYQPQRVFYFGTAISFVTLLSLSTVVFIRRRR